MTQLHTQPVLLGAFLDTLELNVYQTDSDMKPIKGSIHEELKEELTLLKEQAQENDDDVLTRFAFHGACLLMTPKGGKGFQWILKNDFMTLSIKRVSKMMLVARVRCSSEYLWEMRDLPVLLNEVYSFLVEMLHLRLWLQISACDLAADIAYLDIGSVTAETLKEHFISRAQATDEKPLNPDGMIDGPEGIKRRWGRLTGLPFGVRNAKVSALLYDKTHEIKYHSPEKVWFRDLWLSLLGEDGQPLWDGESPVWRVEIRFRRAALNEMMQEGEFHGIDDAFSLEDHLAGLWSYAVGHVGGGADGLPDGWLRYVMPTDDLNRSRWPVHPAWEVVQSAFQQRDNMPDSAYLRAQQEQEEMLQLVDEELTSRPFASDRVKDARPGRRASELVVTAPAVYEPEPLSLQPYIRKRKQEVNMYRMVAQLAGCMATLEAWRNPKRDDPTVLSDLSNTVHFVYNQVEYFYEEKGRDFSDLVAKKRQVYGIQQAIA